MTRKEKSPLPNQLPRLDDGAQKVHAARKEEKDQPSKRRFEEEGIRTLCLSLTPKEGYGTPESGQVTFAADD